LKNTRNLIGKSQSGDGFALTKVGLEEAATLEYREMMKELAITPKTNLEHQERIKKHLKKSKSIAIFDFLLKHGSLSNAELSPLVGQNQRSHGYHYSLKELRVRRYVEVDPDYSSKGEKFRLANKAFKAKEDRPKENDISTEELAKEITVGLALIESKRNDSRSSRKKLKKEETMKNEDSDGVKDEEMEPNEEDDKMDSKVKVASEDEIQTKDKDTEQPKEKSNNDYVAANSALASVISIDSHSDRNIEEVVVIEEMFNA
jgi:hypothetical protein